MSKTCTVEGCGKKFIARGRCTKHYQEFRVRHKAQRRVKTLSVHPEYKAAIRELVATCPTGHHVDHIVPLKHKDVCGLHVPWNLQYLPKSINASKSNSFDGTYENEAWRKELNENQQRQISEDDKGAEVKTSRLDTGEKT